MKKINAKIMILGLYPAKTRIPFGTAEPAMSTFHRLAHSKQRIAVGIFCTLLLFQTPAFADNRVSQGHCNSLLIKVLNGFKTPGITEIDLGRNASLPPLALPLRIKPGGIKEKIKNQIKRPEVTNYIYNLLHQRTITRNQEKIDLKKYILPENKYTFAIYQDPITGNDRLSLARTGRNPFTNLFSKHYILTNGAKFIRFSGEIWIDSQGILHITNGSGTYAPSASLLPEIRDFFITKFQLNKVITHSKRRYENSLPGPHFQE